MIDPITTISTISAGLKLIEQFRTTALKVMGKTGSEPSVTVNTEGDEDGTRDSEDAPAAPAKLEIRRNGQLAATVRAEDLRMGEWDQQRYETLQRIVGLRFEQFNELDKDYVLAAALQKVQIKQQMDQVKTELCLKFREMLNLYERTLGVPLGDHFSLYSVCDCEPVKT